MTDMNKTDNGPKRVRTARLTLNWLPEADAQLRELAEMQERSRTFVLEKLVAKAHAEAKGGE